MKVAGLVAAAGAGRRAGGPKAVRVMEGDPRTLLERSVCSLQDWGCSLVVAVVRPEHKDLATQAGAVPVVPDPAPAEMIDSLRAGLLLLESSQPWQGFVFAPVDCPGALAAFAASGPALGDLPTDRPLCASAEGRFGHPTYLPRDLWYRLELPAAGLEGARVVLDDAMPFEMGTACLENLNL